jgi:glycosyltransferase involved in cell wall biosynthesis
MKIAVLSTFYPYRGGIAQFNAAIFTELEKQHEVKAFNFSRQYPDFLFPGETQLISENDPATKINTTRILDSINPLTFVKTAKAINTYKPDVLIVRHWISFLAPALGVVTRLINSNIKILMLVDNAVSHDPKWFDAPLAKFLFKKADGFLCMSDVVKKDIAKIIAPQEKKYCLIPHPSYSHFGLSIETVKARQILKVDSHKKTILFFGFIRPYKGLDVLLDAFSLMNTDQDDYQLIIAGECYGSFESYQQQIDNHPLKKHIHVHHQYISDELVPAYFSAADVCVLPYKSATQSGIGSIAHHFKVPIIATNVGGLKESVLHMKNGMIVEESKPDQFAEAIEQYFNQSLKNAFIAHLSGQQDENTWAAFCEKTVTFCETLKN